MPEFVKGSLMTTNGMGEYNSLEVINMGSLEKAIEMINELPREKLAAAIRFIEILKVTDSASWDEILFKAFEETLEEEELSPDELRRVEEGKEQIKLGLGVKASDVWKELGI